MNTEYLSPGDGSRNHERCSLWWWCVPVMPHPHYCCSHIYIKNTPCHIPLICLCAEFFSQSFLIHLSFRCTVCGRHWSRLLCFTTWTLQGHIVLALHLSTRHWLIFYDLLYWWRWQTYGQWTPPADYQRL